METDVLIVGAGPVGLMLACDLRKRGVDHRIVEAKPQREYFCKALGVTPRSLEIFDQMGILDEAVGRGVWLNAMSTTMNGEVVARAEVPPDRWAYGAISLAQYDTEEVLEKTLRARGGGVERGVTVTLVTAGPDSVLCATADGGHIEARYVVGCDGAHSVVRKSAGIGFEGGRYPMVFVLGDVDLEWDLPHDEAFKMVYTVDGEMRNLLVAVPIAGSPRRYRVSMTAPPEYWEEGAVLPDPPSLDFILSIAGEILPRGARISTLRWSSMYRISHRLADRYREGRLFLAGDAAHIHPPIGGLGMNTGLQDAFNLGWKLARVLRGAPAALLDTYHEERHRVGEEVVALTSRRMDDAVDRKETDSERETREEEANTQFAVHYRGSSLCGGEAAGGPQPGDRMPFLDGLHRPRIGGTIRFIELLRPQQFVLLSYGGASPELGSTARAVLRDEATVWQIGGNGDPTRTLVDTRGMVGEAFGAGPGAVLVRPDGYIGWRGQEPGSLREYLGRL